MEEIHDAVPEHLKCPICFEIPQDKVFQCRNGHTYCESCYNSFPDKRCPQCRVYFPKNPIRCRAVEEMLDSVKLEFPCHFQSAGCEKKLDRKDLEKHKLTCKYDFEKFGDMKNICGFFGFQNCSFKFNKATTEEALHHFQFVHGMLSLKVLLTDRFTLVYEDFADIYNSSEATVFTPLIFDQTWWGYQCTYIIVTRFNPLDKTLQFTPFNLIHGWTDSFDLPKNGIPEPVRFTLGNSRAIIYPEHLLRCEGRTLSETNYFAASLKTWFNGDKPRTFSLFMQIELTESNNLKPPKDNQKEDADVYITYSRSEVITPFLLNEPWPTLVRQVCSFSALQDLEKLEWIPYQNYKEYKSRLSPVSTSLKKNVLICRANINNNWLAGYVQIDNEMSLNPPAYFMSPSLINSTGTFNLDDNFEVLYTPPSSFEWVAWADLNSKEPISVHEEEQDLLICESRIISWINFIGTVRKDMKPEDKNIYVLVSKYNS